MSYVKRKDAAALNEQINWELYSSYLYLSMAAYFQSLNLPGLANSMLVQTREELVHAMKFFDFVNERGGRVTLEGIKAPPKEWDSPRAAFEKVYEHEKIANSRINDLVNLALAEKDHAANSFLAWFVTEQVEEESSTGQMAQKLKMVSAATGGLFMIDREAAQRVFTRPAATPQQPSAQ